ncbi:MAG: peptidylprolyl isomerase [Alphaproteobacteria bacterium]|nr:peptidylprolyl isomerase [Alphaproteobacteria bacterium]
MKGKNLLVTLAVAAVLFTGCGMKSAQTIIKVNNTKITQAQFDEIFDKESQSGIAGSMKIDLKDPKNAFMYNLLKSRIISELVVKAMLNDEADKRGIKVTKKDMQEAIKVVIDKAGSKEELDKILKHNGVSVADFKKDLKEQVRMKKLAESLGNSEVTEAEVKDFYQKNADKFKHPEQVRASHILIALNIPELTEVVKSEAGKKELSDVEIQAKVGEKIMQKEKKAKELFEKAQKDPKSFAKLAKENSEDPGSAANGGDLGFFAKGDMVPEFSNAAFNAKPNTVVGPVQSQFGYHIIMVTDRMAEGHDAFETVKDNLTEYLKNQKLLLALDQLVESLKKEVKIEYVNKDYDPEEIQKAVQKSIQESTEAAKEIQEANKK